MCIRDRCMVIVYVLLACGIISFHYIAHQLLQMFYRFHSLTQLNKSEMTFYVNNFYNKKFLICKRGRIVLFLPGTLSIHAFPDTMSQPVSVVISAMHIPADLSHTSFISSPSFDFLQMPLWETKTLFTFCFVCAYNV